MNQIICIHIYFPSPTRVEKMINHVGKSIYMGKLGTIDLEFLDLAIKGNGTFNENNLENSELKRLGVGRILDELGSLKERKLISQNSDGSFSITELAREILKESF